MVLGRGEYYPKGAFAGSRGKLEERPRYKAKCDHAIFLRLGEKEGCLPWKLFMGN